jgi:hypothetical protein
MHEIPNEHTFYVIAESQESWIPIIGIGLSSLTLLLLLMQEGRRRLKNKRQKEEQYGLVPVIYNQDRCRTQGTIPGNDKFKY